MAAGVDKYDHEDVELSSPAAASAVITPHATDDLPFTSRGLYVGTGGNVTMLLADDTAETLFVGLVAGTTYPFRVKAVRVTGTTADDLVALY